MEFILIHSFQPIKLPQHATQSYANHYLLIMLLLTFLSVQAARTSYRFSSNVEHWALDLSLKMPLYHKMPQNDKQSYASHYLLIMLLLSVQAARTSYRFSSKVEHWALNRSLKMPQCHKMPLCCKMPQCHKGGGGGGGGGLGGGMSACQRQTFKHLNQLNRISHSFALLNCEISWSTLEIKFIFPHSHVLFSIYSYYSFLLILLIYYYYYLLLLIINLLLIIINLL